MPKVVNYFVRPEGMYMSVPDLENIQYGGGKLEVV